MVHESPGVGTSPEVDALVQLSFAVQLTLTRIAADNDLSVTQLRLLGILRDRTPPMAAIADYLELDRSSVSGLVDRAERRGLVLRRTADNDARVSLVELTAHGRDVGARIARAVSESLDALLKSRSAADPIRAAIEEHWRASESGDSNAEHAMYADDAILDYPQSGERFRGRATIAAQRGGHPAERHFAVQRIVGSGNLWVSECIITYDSVPTYSVSVMEFADEKIAHERQYFADPFPAPASRAPLADPI